MADYKDIIAGTLNSIVGKVKEVADSGAIRDIYEHGADRAKSYGQIAKLSFEINGENEELKRIYAEIGKLYFSQTEEPEGFFVPLFNQAEQILDAIEDKQQQIQYIKDSFAEDEGEETCDDCEGIEVDFEDVVEETEADGVSISVEIDENGEE